MQEPNSVTPATAYAFGSKMERTILKLRKHPEISEAWFQRRWLWIWWTVKFKIGPGDEVFEWAVAQGVHIIFE